MAGTSGAGPVGEFARLWRLPCLDVRRSVKSASKSVALGAKLSVGRRPGLSSDCPALGKVIAKLGFQ